MDYEKAYKEALEKLRYKISDNDGNIDYNEIVNVDELQDIFPELQESKNEMPQKDIINTIEKNIENIVNDEKYAPEAKDFIIKELEEQIAWFKKQDEQKNINPTLLEKEKMDNAFTQMMFKRKTALEAKFHKGDWIANNNSGAVCQVIEIRDDEYCLWPLDAEMMGYLRIIDVDNDYHLWTIEDAKEGDILVNKAYDAVLIFKSIRNNYLFSSYCDYFVNTFKAKQFSQWASSAFIPATKKQRNFLFAKIREAGYEWDDNKKELRKILQIPTDKVYPKFHEGDWIIYRDEGCTEILRIISVTDTHYICIDISDDYCRNLSINFIDNHNYHLWTIRDVKDGDVLAWDNSKCIAIFKNIYDKESFNSYGCVGHCTGTFEARLSYHDIEGVHPATKKQRDLLFEKMKEAGYEWDSEEKTLRKIIHNPTDKIKPKFHEGDWIYCTSVSDIRPARILNILVNRYYEIEFNDGNKYLQYIDYTDKHFHPWTIADAKDGDVLVTTFDEDNMIVMYHSMCTIDTINVHCCLDNKFVCWNLGVFDAEDVKPATKEQRDLLFKKMHEASYEWDTEKKTLRKIIHNPTDNVEPKFHEGDWIVNNNTKDVFLIKSINNEYCTLEDIKGNIISPCLPPCESESHIWTIKDAKDGDVLISKNGVNILIFRNIDTNTSFSSYYNIKGRGELGWSNKSFIPANKEQCDLLFSKIKEAGYEWDAEKKELRKFEKQDEQITL